MRKFDPIVPDQIPTFCIGEVSDDKFYGFVKIDSKKGFITKSDFGKGDYIQKDFELINDGHGWYSSSPSLRTLIEHIHEEGSTVYEFDTYLELLLWGAE